VGKMLAGVMLQTVAVVDTSVKHAKMIVDWCVVPTCNIQLQCNFCFSYMTKLTANTDHCSKFHYLTHT